MQKQQKNSIQCKTCGEQIPFVNYPIHEVRCLMKNEPNILDKQRKPSHFGGVRHRKTKIFDKKKQESKLQQEEKIPCSFCGYMQTLAQLDSHPDQCVGKELLCKHCGQGYPKQLMMEHESLCEANQQNQHQEVIQVDPSERLMQLIQLINSIGTLVRRLQVNGGGYSPQKLKLLKKFKYKPSKQQELCTICYCQMQKGEQCIQLKCKHIYHTQCISKWLEQSSKCPVCKQDQNKLK